MRGAAEFDRPARGDAFGGFRLLFDQRNALRDVAPGAFRKRTSFEADGAGFRWTDAGQKRDQAGLAGAVRTDDPEKFTRQNLEIDSIDDQPAAGRPAFIELSRNRSNSFTPLLSR